MSTTWRCRSAAGRCDSMLAWRPRARTSTSLRRTKPARGACGPMSAASKARRWRVGRAQSARVARSRNGAWGSFQSTSRAAAGGSSAYGRRRRRAAATTTSGWLGRGEWCSGVLLREPLPHSYTCQLNITSIIRSKLLRNCTFPKLTKAHLCFGRRPFFGVILQNALIVGNGFGSISSDRPRPTRIRQELRLHEVKTRRGGAVFVCLSRLAEAPHVLISTPQEPIGLRPVRTRRPRSVVLHDGNSLLGLPLHQPYVREQQPRFCGGVRPGVVLDHLRQLTRRKRQILILECKPRTLQIAAGDLLRAALRRQVPNEQPSAHHHDGTDPRAQLPVGFDPGAESIGKRRPLNAGNYGACCGRHCRSAE